MTTEKIFFNIIISAVHKKTRFNVEVQQKNLIVQFYRGKTILYTPDRRQSRTISHFQKNRLLLPNKAFSFAMLAIDKLKLDVFDCNYIDFGNRKR